MADARPEPTWTRVALAEYQAHRAEVLAMLSLYQQTFGFGLTALGIVIAGAFNLWTSHPLLAALMFIVPIPLIAVIVQIQLLATALAVARQGDYLYILEKAFREAYVPLPKDILTWEARWVRPGDAEDEEGQTHGPSPLIAWAQGAQVTIFSLMAIGSLALGSYRGFNHHATLALPLASTGLLITAAATIFMVLSVRRIKADRLRLAKEASSAGALPTTNRD